MSRCSRNQLRDLHPLCGEAPVNRGARAMKAVDQEIRKLVAEAADFAESSPEPDAKELYTDVLVESY